MKTAFTGLVDESRQNYSFKPDDVFFKERQKVLAVNDARGKRENGDSSDNPGWEFPADGAYTYEISQYLHYGSWAYGTMATYIGGSKDREWMAEKDGNYLRRILRAGNLRTLESAVWYLREQEAAQALDIGAWWSEKLKLNNVDAILKEAEATEKQYVAEENLRQQATVLQTQVRRTEVDHLFNMLHTKRINVLDLVVWQKGCQEMIDKVWGNLVQLPQDKTVTAQLTVEELNQLLHALAQDQSVKSINLAHINLSVHVDALVAMLLARSDFTAITLSETMLDTTALQRLVAALYNNSVITQITIVPNNLMSKVESASLIAQINSIIARNQRLKTTHAASPIAEQNKTNVSLPLRLQTPIAKEEAVIYNDEQSPSQLPISRTIRLSQQSVEQEHYFSAPLSVPHIPAVVNMAAVNPSEPYLIAAHKLTFGPMIGAGGYGVVYQGNYEQGEVAIKKLTIKHMADEVEQEFKNEIAIMAQFHHPNIVNFYGYCMQPDYCIVMELLNFSLYNILHDNSRALPWDMRLTIAKDIIAGLLHLHSKNIIHRDLKSLNILLDGNMRAKLTDFGLAKVKNETKTTTKASGGAVGTVHWMAPELLGFKPQYSQKSDIYSYGMTLWELSSRGLPYRDVDMQVIIAEVKQGNREEIPSSCPKKISSLIKFCWAQEPEKRPSSEHIADYLQSSEEEFNNERMAAVNI